LTFKALENSLQQVDRWELSGSTICKQASSLLIAELIHRPSFLSSSHLMENKSFHLALMA